MTRRRIALLLAAVAAAAAAVYWNAHRLIYIPGALPQQAYVDSVAWSTPAVQDAIAAHGSAMDELVFVAVDVSLSGDRPFALFTPVDFPFLAAHHLRTGLSVHITLPASPGQLFAAESPTTRMIAAAAQEIVHLAEDKKVDVRELQIDCTTAAAYPQGLENWIAAVKAGVGQCPVIVVAPLDWLGDSHFAAAVRSADGFVLKIPPGRSAAQMEQDVAQAARWGAPFRAVLPTYSTMEQPSLHADPKAAADLVNTWRNGHPKNMTAIVWDYLGSDESPQTWRWATLKSVMNGVIPQPDVKLEFRHPEKNLTEIDLLNSGDGDADATADVMVTWSDADLEDAQALNGFEREETGRLSETLHTKDSLRARPLRSGEQRAIGWVRLTDGAPIHAQFSPPSATGGPSVR